MKIVTSMTHFMKQMPGNMKEKEFKELGVNIVIYGNHLIRGAYPAMVKTAESILEYGRCKEATEQYCMPIKEIITLIPE